MSRNSIQIETDLLKKLKNNLKQGILLMAYELIEPFSSVSAGHRVSVRNGFFKNKSFVVLSKVCSPSEGHFVFVDPFSEKAVSTPSKMH